VSNAQQAQVSTAVPSPLKSAVTRVVGHADGVYSYLLPSTPRLPTAALPKRICTLHGVVVLMVATSGYVSPLKSPVTAGLAKLRDVPLFNAKPPIPKAKQTGEANRHITISSRSCISAGTGSAKEPLKAFCGQRAERDWCSEVPRDGITGAKAEMLR
jgi:hypothetical protein